MYNKRTLVYPFGSLFRILFNVQEQKRSELVQVVMFDVFTCGQREWELGPQRAPRGQREERQEPQEE